MTSRKPFLSERIRIDASLREIQLMKEKLGDIPIHHWIRDLRKRLHMSQTQLAKRAKVSQSQLSLIESGNAKIKVATLEKIFGALFCEILIIPLLQKDLDSILGKQAQLAAKKQLSPLMGSMDLEDQLPSKEYLTKKIEEVSNDLLRSGTTEIWDL
jgi:transcriptional regulator with XRE-family HTH domain